MKPALLLPLIGIVLAACAGLKPPKPPGENHFCRPDSAIRYRGAVDPRTSVVRVAPAHGSCRRS